jgi:hypothetical protein
LKGKNDHKAKLGASIHKKNNNTKASFGVVVYSSSRSFIERWELLQNKQARPA